MMKLLLGIHIVDGHMVVVHMYMLDFEEGQVVDIVVHFVEFEDKILEELERYSQMEHDMRNSLKKGEFYLVFQPKHNAYTGALEGAETQVVGVGCVEAQPIGDLVQPRAIFGDKPPRAGLRVGENRRLDRRAARGGVGRCGAGRGWRLGVHRFHSTKSRSPRKGWRRGASAALRPPRRHGRAGLDAPRARLGARRAAGERRLPATTGRGGNRGRGGRSASCSSDGAGTGVTWVGTRRATGNF